MSAMNSKRERGFWYYERIEKDYNLTTNQTKLYSWIRRHCVDYKDYGFCGFSNERIAEEVRSSLSQVKRDLKELVNKNLIIIKNPGRRTKKTGQSREIYISLEPYKVVNQMNIDESIIESLKEKIARLEELLRQATSSGIEPNAFVFRLYKGLGITDPGEINRLARNLNAAYESFTISWGYAEMMKHIEYMIVQVKKEKPDHLTAYLFTSLEQYNRRLSSSY